MNTDYVYWTFTAAAQCVSTFVALLLTGYALVLSQIEAAREGDESLAELHAVLRASYHARLTVLAWVTAISVVLSLVVVWVNRSDKLAPSGLMGAAAAFDIVAMVAGLAFVVAIIDPRRYQKAAARELQQQQPSPEMLKLTSVDDFFQAFRLLEQTMREELKRLHISLPEREGGKTGGSVRQMATALLDHALIDDDLHAELVQLNKYRNLVFHGHVQQADAGMVERVHSAAAKVIDLG